MPHHRRASSQASGWKPPANLAGPLARTCPTCDAAPGERCWRLRYDADRVAYVVGRLKSVVHPNRHPDADT